MDPWLSQKRRERALSLGPTPFVFFKEMGSRFFISTVSVKRLQLCSQNNDMLYLHDDVIPTTLLVGQSLSSGHVTLQKRKKQYIMTFFSPISNGHSFLRS